MANCPEGIIKAAIGSVSPRTLLFLTGKTTKSTEHTRYRILEHALRLRRRANHHAVLTADTVILLAVTGQGIHLPVDTGLIPWVHL